MYVHRPFLSLAAVIMPSLGVYLLLCGPKKRPTRKPRALRGSRQRQRRQESDRTQVDTVSADMSESRARKRNVNISSDDNDNIEDTNY